MTTSLKLKINPHKNLLENIFFTCVLLTFCYFFFFNQLGGKTLNLWDESRNAVNALEMSESNNFLVTTYNGKPDKWNTKPPLLIITQSLFIKILGPKELAIRLPSAICTTLTVLFLFFYISKVTKSKLLAFLSAFVLITTRGLISFHGVRYAEYEGMLMLFSTIFTLLFLYYLHSKKIKYLYLTTIAFSLAFMTKSSASSLFLPGLLICLLLSKQTIDLLKNKHFYFAILIPIVVIGSYYIYREIVTPGYLKIVYENEFGGRAFSVIEGHALTFDAYFKNLKNFAFRIWIYTIPFGIIFTFFEKNSRIKKLFIASAILAVSHMLIISLLKTRILWYMLPEYPFWSILAAISVYQVISFIIKFIKKPVIKVITAVILISPLIYYNIMDVHKQFKYEILENKNVKLFLRDEFRKYIDKENDQVNFITVWYKQGTNFYIKILLNEGYQINYSSVYELDEGKIFLLDNTPGFGKERPLITSVRICMFYDEICEYDTYSLLCRIERLRTHQESVDFIKNTLLSNEDKNKIIETAKKNNVDFETQLNIYCDQTISEAKNELKLN
ncbi:MAG: glycosyltransferase family 39 protein [Bacteroidales bacterium]|jgi:hypothetical protein|nr:glycosyltransferase family 39 protein [Bacteroidales bacterium]